MPAGDGGASPGQLINRAIIAPPARVSSVDELIGLIRAAPDGISITALLERRPKLARRTVQRWINELVAQGRGWIATFRVCRMAVETMGQMMIGAFEVVKIFPLHSRPGRHTAVKALNLFQADKRSSDTASRKSDRRFDFTIV